MFFAIAGMVAAIASGVVKGVAEVQNAKAQMKAVHEQAQVQVDERARKAKSLLSEQKNAFLKSGVFFEGTPELILEETYNFARADMQAINNDSIHKQKYLKRQGQTAFTVNVLQGVQDGAGIAGMMGGGGGGGAGAFSFAGSGSTSTLSGGFDVSNAGVLGGGAVIA